MSDNTSPEKPKLHFMYIFALIMAVLMFFAAIGYAVYWPRFGNQKSDAIASSTVKAPDLAGHDLAQAKKMAKMDGFSLKVDHWVASKIYTANSVVAQEPLPNTTIKAGGTINVTVSSGIAKSSSSSKGPEQVRITDNPKPLPSPALRPIDSSASRVVVIDPGHQQKADLTKEPIAPGSKTLKAKTQGGTRGRVTRTPEYKVTLQISERLKAVLEKNNIKVVMTRESDDVNVSNVERAQIGNDARADLVIRVHADGSTDKNKSGISTLYPADNEWTGVIYADSLEAAKYIHESMIKTTGHNDNGIVARSDLTGFNWSKVPTVLVETGFLTNQQEETDLLDASYQEELVKAIADGVIKYFQ